MSKSICIAVRRQLDEMDLHEVQGTEISEHLGNCDECRDFHQKQASLRQLVGSLGTVSAPADFDFRLRARLADDTGKSVHFLSIANWSIFQRSVAVATALALIIGAAVFVRQFKNRSDERSNVMNAGGVAPNKPQVPSASPVTPPQQQTVTSREDVGIPQKSAVRREKTSRQMASGPRKNSALEARDSASQGATVTGVTGLTGVAIGESVFPIDAAQQSLRVSLFDGRGNPRTISLPGVTFGSQKVVPSTTSYAPKGVW